MASSTVSIAKRALVSLLLKLAVAYQVVVSVSRDSPDVSVKAAFRKIAVKVHPDKGGDTADFQRPQGAEERWEAAAKDAKNGRPPEAHNRGGGRKAPRETSDILCADLTNPEEAKKQCSTACQDLQAKNTEQKMGRQRHRAKAERKRQGGGRGRKGREQQEAKQKHETQRNTQPVDFGRLGLFPSMLWLCRMMSRRGGTWAAGCEVLPSELT